MKHITCSSCGRAVSAALITCPSCGAAVGYRGNHPPSLTADADVSHRLRKVLQRPLTSAEEAALEALGRGSSEREVQLTLIRDGAASDSSEAAATVTRLRRVMKSSDARPVLGFSLNPFDHLNLDENFHVKDRPQRAFSALWFWRGIRISLLGVLLAVAGGLLGIYGGGIDVVGPILQAAGMGLIWFGFVAFIAGLVVIMVSLGDIPFIFPF